MEIQGKKISCFQHQFESKQEAKYLVQYLTQCKYIINHHYNTPDKVRLIMFSRNLKRVQRIIQKHTECQSSDTEEFNPKKTYSNALPPLKREIGRNKNYTKSYSRWKLKMELLILFSYYRKHQGKWDKPTYLKISSETGLSKRQLQKWLWDQNKKFQDTLKYKKLAYPGLIFRITNEKTGQDLTQLFRRWYRPNQFSRLRKL